MFNRFIFALAALYGALGVAGLAMASHLNVKGSFGSAAQILLFHAPALMAVASARAQGFFQRHIGFAALLVLALGVFLFAADVGLRAYWGKGLFPYAAPTGGMMMIGAWCGLAFAAFARGGR